MRKHDVNVLLKSFALGSLVFFAALRQGSAQSAPSQPPLTDFNKLEDGDIVFIESNSERAPAIKKLTESNLTHCGIVFRDQHSNWIVYEGAGYPHIYRPLGEWIGRESGEGKINPIYVRRLRDRETRLSPKSEALRTKARQLHDTSYDMGFAWANKDSSSKEYIYCSELVWKAFYEAVGIALNKPHPLEDYITKTPDGAQRNPDEQKAIGKVFDEYLNNQKSKDRRDGQPYRRDELAISPAEVFGSTELDAVTDATPSVSPAP